LFSDFKKWSNSEKNVGFKKYYQLAKHSRCILDIGSHIGLTVMPVSLICKNQLHSFELSPTNFKLLKKHIIKNNITNVALNNYCVGDKCKKILIKDSLISTPNFNLVTLSDSFFCKKLIIDMITIDKYVKEKNILPDLIKIDVEGYEYFVLKGCKDTIKKFNPKIVLSYHPNLINQYGINQMDFFNLLNKLNLRIFDIDGNVPRKLKNSDYLLVYKDA
jgi:FkbM family methyltransferase